MAWTKGQSGNPNGRPVLTDAERKAREMLCASSPLAVATLINAMKAGGPEGLKAAVAVLNKLWPTGVDLTVSGPDGGPVELMHVAEVVQSVDRMRAIALVLQKAGALPAATDAAEPIETVEPVELVPVP